MFISKKKIQLLSKYFYYSIIANRAGNTHTFITSWQWKFYFGTVIGKPKHPIYKLTHGRRLQVQSHFSLINFALFVCACPFDPLVYELQFHVVNEYTTIQYTKTPRQCVPIVHLLEILSIYVYVFIPEYRTALLDKSTTYVHSSDWILHICTQNITRLVYFIKRN